MGRNRVYGEAMDAQAKDARRAEIEAIAYRLLAERGYGGMSMLAVAKAAGASNETLYRWYGDKPGLVRAMIAGNAAAVLARLEELAETPQPLAQELRTVGEALLDLLVGERSVALNRAAAADASGDLGARLAEGGRETVMPRLAAMLARHRLQGEAAAEAFLALLLGDWPIRRVTAAMAMPDVEAREARIAAAVEQFTALVRQECFTIRKQSARQPIEKAQFSLDL